MNIVEVPMYRKNGTRVQLGDLLARIPNNDWTWIIIEFDGVGQMPFQLSLSEFQKKLRELPQGLTLTWAEVLRFAESVEYTIDCLIVAVSTLEKMNISTFMEDDFRLSEVALRAIDSTEWILAASEISLLDDLTKAARD